MSQLALPTTPPANLPFPTRITNDNHLILYISPDGVETPMEIGACWENANHPDSSGYGKFNRDGKTQSSSRWSYETFIGPCPTLVDGVRWDVDHLCGNRLCYRTSHLQHVTHQLNSYRSTIAEANRKRYEGTTEFRCGHTKAPENTYLWTDKNTGRAQSYCRICKKANQQSRNKGPA